MQINSIALEEQTAASEVTLMGDYPQSWRSIALARCFDATKKYFETFTSAPISEYYNMSFAEWARLIQVLKVMSRLCFPIIGAPEWDDEKARKEARFGMIMESILYRMQELTATGKPRQHVEEAKGSKRVEDEHSGLKSSALPPDHFFMFKSVLKILKDVYDERVDVATRDAKREGSSRQRGSRCPVLNGSIQDSEYWEALQCSNMMSANGYVPLDSELGGLDLAVFQDWDVCSYGFRGFDELMKD